MITVLNRKLLLSTFSLEEQARARDLLSDHGIRYEYKVVNRLNATSVGAGNRTRFGSEGMKGDLMYEYLIYVAKKDFDTAQAVIRK